MIQEIKNISTTQPVQQNKLELNEAKITMGEEIVNGDKVSLSAEEIEGIIKELNQFIQIFNTKIAFEIDKETKKTILRIVDVETNEVIRQIPPEELLKISRRISELLGLIINEKI
ncbi:flagellar protein FlaG [Candidatus Kryptonium thompsonii]|jgi:flagellar protein FlaG|uniref:Flagellar protein FlaG n=1 Tax=Candidatus Kryptonium thompsonii TaxID=1633631 RepID=A0A0P1LUX8_9BACT|nr:flagellar protein FlaG [Candidatus Kryptonium thompsoni]CUS78319.1 flagellar protein FlaG [Candidatus Kryptonium thompsoni]CUS80367.1 flagellar protein FlaG [Candidatus Kryptonium thompsoni]CUS83881.1 flagellar protein FlaG [Candidatus Kryptonium thompsoni]CUS85753.1 flagellar protein FlaG [Candidatus Kryptonium thompsoni]CUS88453.1 flagellar protein FlaG [Candidatus Kryptonium thompsoni]